MQVTSLIVFSPRFRYSLKDITQYNLLSEYLFEQFKCLKYRHLHSHYRMIFKLFDSLRLIFSVELQV